MIHLLFFLSGASGLVYQVVWVRMFGNVFGNTIYSASIVVAVFMLGLGAGSWLIGAWADRRYAAQPDSLLRAYGQFELAIAGMGLAIALVLPHLGALSALASSYVREPNGWYALSTASYVARGAIAIVLLTPMTLLMGGTLTLLIRHLVRGDLDTSGWRIAVLYGVNTAGAALGAVLTDFALVPAWGLFETQIVAVALNAVAGLGALVLAGWASPRGAGSAARHPAYLRRARVRAAGSANASVGEAASANTSVRRAGSAVRRAGSAQRTRQIGSDDAPDCGARVVVLTSLALAMTGLAALGMEILWFRHFTILLGGFRAVFSLLLTLILLGIGAGSLAGGALDRRTRRPAEWLMVVQGLFVASTLFGLAGADVEIINSDPAGGGPGAALGGTAVAVGALAELWFNARPMLGEVALPALLMGFSFPLANAVIQRAEQAVGRRAGILYLSNTAGAVCGSLLAGFVLLPWFGLQVSATVLMVVSALAIVPLYFTAGPLLPSPGGTRPTPSTAGPLLPSSSGTRPTPSTAGPVLASPGGTRPTYAAAGPVLASPGGTRPTYAAAGPVLASPSGTRPTYAAAALIIAGVALALWLRLPSDYVAQRALGRPDEGEQRLTVSDGLTELIAVTELPGKGRTLVTNGHAMSSTRTLSQRYMRALAHIPLLSMERPERVLVIGFGVGNTTHAATLHPSVRRVDLADLSRGILAHASYFADANRDVLASPKVAVHINDGRQHLQMQPAGSYDLVVLEPPPIAYAGVSALYSREFYALARSRLTAGGYLSQWLPTYQVPPETTLAMVRAFVDIFPEAVLLSGAESDLLLLGVNGDRLEIDPERLAAALARAPEVRADLERVSLGSPREIAGTFVGSSRTLADATRDAAPVRDDRPLQEYGVRSMLTFGHGVPGSIVALDRIADWCPRCFADGRPVAAVGDLDTYSALLDLAYSASPAEVVAARRAWEAGGREIDGSGYLGAIVPESAATHNVIGIGLAQRGALDRAVVEFRAALALEPDSAAAHWHLGAALASTGAREEAAAHLARSVELDPRNSQAQSDLGLMLAVLGRFDEAVDHLQQALALDPQLDEARRNLDLLRQRRPRVAPQP